jgi:hypothetical protein
LSEIRAEVSRLSSRVNARDLPAGELILLTRSEWTRTIEQGARALMWSVRMIGVAPAFLAPWIIALAAFIGIVRGIRRSRRHREH